MIVKPKEYLLPFVFMAALIAVSLATGLIFCDRNQPELNLNILVPILGLIFAGLLFYYYLRQFGFARGWAITGLLALVSSYQFLTILYKFAPEPPNFLAFMLITGAFLFLRKSNPIIAALCFTIGAITSEAIIFLMPAFLIIVWSKRIHPKIYKIIITITIPVIFYIYYGTARLEYFYLPQHLELHPLVIGTYYFLGFGLLLPTLLITQTFDSSSVKMNLSGYFWGGWATVIILLIHLIITENLAAPMHYYFSFVLIIPIALFTLQKAHYHMRTYLNRSGRIVFLLIFHFLMIWSSIFVERLNSVIHVGVCPFVGNKWMGINIGFTISLFILFFIGIIYRLIRKNPIPPT